jgi:predicted membrane protein
MSMSNSIRTFHRWTSIVFMIPVIANFVIYGIGRKPQAWVTYAPLLPLALLVFTGLYMFFLPYVAKRRNAGGAR